MSEFYCHCCGETIKLDREIIQCKSGLTNMAYWCHKNPILQIRCLSNTTLQLMAEIKESGEECHLINWDYSKEWIKVSKESPNKVEENDTETGSHPIINALTVIGVFVILPAVIMLSANYLCDYISKQLN